MSHKLGIINDSPAYYCYLSLIDPTYQTHPELPKKVYKLPDQT